ncbi:DUF397 domain-containing protein [Streptomyces sp. Rer75]|uniref:DUF397 domain-containing protein n=1 Tax=unclassified Streptomyces TaxID=2593676 RepID=UPI0015D0A1C5|nr:DUF397 domain-containing protein [Streptomyces sp. Rer75]QLH21225.1 DUF397 domain-containing protein [Streptomyces sp. Rer75]
MGNDPVSIAVRWRKSSYSADQGECVECAPLGGATWRKSSHSSDIGNCVEAAPLDGAAWRKSSYSGDIGGSQCVEVAGIPGRVAVRDSKNPDGPVLLLSPTAFGDFVTAAANGTL